MKQGKMLQAYGIFQAWQQICQNPNLLTEYDFIHIDKNRHGDNFADFINDDLVTLDGLGIPRKRNNLDHSPADQ